MTLLLQKTNAIAFQGFVAYLMTFPFSHASEVTAARFIDMGIEVAAPWLPISDDTRPVMTHGEVDMVH